MWYNTYKIWKVKNMDDNIVLIKELREAWKLLSFEIKKSKRIQIELFNDTFSRTYSLLSELSTENSLDKNCIELIAEAFLFANTKDDSLDQNCLAAFILTERMLTSCAFNTTSSPIKTSSVYVFETRSEITLNFNNVNESMLKLTEVFLASL